MRYRFSFAATLFGALVVVLTLFARPAVAAPTFPALTGRVVDEAGVLSPDAQTRLTNMSQALEQKTHDQLVIVTLKSLQGYPIEQYGYQLGRHWGIGQKGHDNGALLIVAPNEHKVRIEVGYGLEGTLTDAQSALIINNAILPAFRRNDFSGGTAQGAAAILHLFGVETADVDQAIAHQTQPSNDQGAPGGSGFLTIFVVIIFWIVFGRFLWPLLLIGGFGDRRGSLGGGYDDAGLGGGGFSGGGGSFGGGGASGSW